MPTPDLISRAACFFVLAEQASRLDWQLNKSFWDLSVSPVVETASHLPAMAAVVMRPVDLFWKYVLRRVARHPLPGVLPPEAVRWHDCLVAAWELYRASSNVNLQNLARLALVRLDGCGMPDGHQRPSRLPEWLVEAQKIASGEWRVVYREWQVASGHGDQKGDRKWRPEVRTYRCYDWDTHLEVEALAALAAWRPAPRVITPPETLRAWVDFWMEMRRSAASIERGIAAIALLNLPEADLRAASIPPVPAGELLQQLTTAIRVAAEITNPNYLFLLDGQPVKESIWPAAELRGVVQSWLEATRHKDWANRCTAWRQLIRWDRAGSLALCGMDLLPELVKALQLEKKGDVLRAMAQWLPSAERFTVTGTPDSLSQLQQLESAWERHRTSGYSLGRAAAWPAGLCLQQAGLASETPESFIRAYLREVARTRRPDVAFALAQWSPGTEVPGKWHQDWNAAWQRRLLNKNEFIKPIAAWALLRQSLETGQDRLLRGAALELWRTGTKAPSNVKDTLNAVFARFQEVRACLSAGEVVDFEEKPTSPAERSRPPLALPPGRIVGSEWKIENGEWKMENGRDRFQTRPRTMTPF